MVKSDPARGVCIKCRTSLHKGDEVGVVSTRRQYARISRECKVSRGQEDVSKVYCIFCFEALPL